MATKKIKGDPNIPDTWPSWTDALGQTYEPGDFIAYASISGRSPQLVFAKVLSIPRKDSQGEEIRAFDHYEDHPVDTYANGRPVQVRVTSPSCKVKVLPLLDARGFYRGGSRTGDVKAVTLSIPQNIIKVTPRPEWTDEHHIAGLQELREELG